MTRLPRGSTYYLAAVLAGISYVAGNVGGVVWFFALVCYIPLFWALESARGRALRHSFWLGCAMGAALYISGFGWLLVLADGFMGGSALATYGLWVAYGALVLVGVGLAALLHAWLLRRGTNPLLAAITPWVLLEWWQPSLFPVHLGAALISAPQWVQIADLGGPLLLSAWLLCVNAGVFYGWRQRRQWRPAVIMLAVSVAAFPFIYGVWRQGALEASNPSTHLKVGVIQANITQRDKARYEGQSHAVHLDMSRTLATQQAMDLLVWPESAYPRGLRLPLPLDGQSITRDLHVPLLFGGTSIDQHAGQRVSANSVFLINSEGMLDQVYNKQLLIPFAESLAELPLPAPVKYALAGLFPHHQNFKAGERNLAFTLGDVSFVTPVCFEMIHSSFVRNLVRESDADVIITLANDDWFAHSRAPGMHLALAQLRAIESRRWVVRSTSTGVSAVINPLGQVVARTGFGTQEVLYAPMPVYRGTSLYLILGDWPGWVALAVLVMITVPRRYAAPKPSSQLS